jgi:hypothetical protein
VRVANRIYHSVEQLAGLDGFERACALEDLGWSEDAAAAYRALLAADPNDFGALTNLGLMLVERDAPAYAEGLLGRAAALRPDDPNAHVNLALAASGCGDVDAAQRAYERAVALDPACAPAHQGLADCFEARGDDARAAAERALAFAQPTCWVLPYRGSAPPVRVLVLVSARGGDLVTNVFLDDTIFQTLLFAVETYRDGLALPPHDVVWCAIGDPDRAPEAIAQAGRIAAASGKRVLNDPGRVAVTGRVANSRRFARRPGLVVPRTERFTRAHLTAEVLARRGWRYPLLVRSPGFHAGRNFARIAQPGELASTVAQLPGRELFAIAFVDVADRSGYVRKFRALFIDGRLYPAHLAIGTEWKVHYFSSLMTTDAQARAEEERFLRDPAGFVGAAAWETVRAVGAELGLEYAGVDFALDATGSVVVFEANATMAVYPPPPDELWAYRRAPIDEIVAAVRAALVARRSR